MTDEVRKYHRVQATAASSLYVASQTPAVDRDGWEEAVALARQELHSALVASNYLTDLAAALLDSGAHMRSFRHLTAPPISQDQFALACREWKKSSEQQGGPRVKLSAIPEIVRAFGERRSRKLSPWIEEVREATGPEVELLLTATAPLMASQFFNTAKRNLIAAKQEGAVTSLLDRNGWTKVPASVLDARGTLAVKHYMHKTRFATATSTAQEVDIAMGLQKAVVLAVECKVTNDETNSVKRVNDILKKSAAWKTHWGNTVKTAAILQGVIAYKDVERLLDDGVAVFWSHDLDRFEAWTNTLV